MRRLRLFLTASGLSLLGVVHAACGGATDGAPASADSPDASASSSSGGGSTSDAGNTNDGIDSGGKDAGGDAGQRVPKKHRAAAATCSNDRGPGDANPNLGFAPCTSDAECTAGDAGRCVHTQGGPNTNNCTYDSCYTDSACGPKQVCTCRVPGSLAANYCVDATSCATDADCAGSYCSPSVDFDKINTGVKGYYCHTSSDECVDDEDCSGKVSMACAWNGSHWACSDKQFLPP